MADKHTQSGSQPKDAKSLTGTWWRVASNKPTAFGFYYRWYLPKFVYSWVMDDLQFINRNHKLIYKRAGYKPKDQPKVNDLEPSDHE